MTAAFIETPAGRSFKFIVFTDLDGTLLDDSYRWEAATPALEALKSRGFPLILSSSKTLDEMTEIAMALDTGAPLIAENGGLIAVPRNGKFDNVPGACETVGNYHVAINGLRRTEVAVAAHALREAGGYQFEGFSDWGTAEVCDATGLSEAQARLSLNRLATEPILWHDTSARWDEFAAALQERGIGAVKGGRFIHLSGNIDKAMGLARVVDLYNTLEPETHWHVVALGDSPNDLAMLSAADTAVAIPNPRHPAGLAPTAPAVVHAPHPGPLGWNAVISELLKPHLDPV